MENTNIVAAMNFKIAQLATDRGVQAAAYLVAASAALVVVSWLLSGISEFMYFQRVLQEAGRD